MQQFNQLKSWTRSSQPKSQDPVLTAEDEAFLRNIMSEPAEQPPATSAEGPISPVSPLASGAPTILSPVSPVEEFGRELGEEERKAREREEQAPVPPAKPESSGKAPPQAEKKWKPWEWLRRKSTQDKKEKEPSPKDTQNETMQDDIPTNNKNDSEMKQETEDMTDILDRLNLAADNNRVFSISDDTQELLRKFKLIFKDLINGVPTAYHDLEMLLTNGNNQLQKTYSDLPGPLQKLVEKLPERWTESLAPEMLAVASERASRSGLNVENVGKAAAAANKMGLQVPSLKELVGKPAAIVGMLRSIVAFLRARFPAVLGMNVLWSIALFLLLFVLWYCHKRGREVRLENERLVTEEEINKMNEESSDGERIRTTETLTTTAPSGASAAEIREGVKEAQQSRESATASASEGQPKEDNTEARTSSFSKPSRSKSRLSIFGRPTQKPVSKVEPYPGT
ncbi:hypothetical protein FE257_012538 [Aspergillus nanangensis]|uniref:Uncharacterized protein n=1 Tax=Aspergillus nanangensis TaxID=2582783 RepID=A0AAD4GXP1_ASPNN|nr:hypothetical protein FE257_012538 [Aspergillus nanangensis]